MDGSKEPRDKVKCPRCENDGWRSYRKCVACSFVESTNDERKDAEARVAELEKDWAWFEHAMMKGLIIVGGGDDPPTRLCTSTKPLSSGATLQEAVRAARNAEEVRTDA